MRAERAEAEGFYSLMTEIAHEARSAARIETTRVADAPVWKCAAIEWPLFNRTIGLGLFGDVTDHDLDEIQRFYGDRPHSIEASPLASTLDPRRLESRGYTVTVSRPKFVRASEPRDMPEGIAVCLAKRPDADKFADTAVASFGMPEGARPLIESIAATPHPKRACVLAVIDGRIAGTGFLFVRDQIGWLGGGCCLPEFRGRGVQRALIEGRSAIAKDMGAKWVTAETNPDSAENPGYSMRNMIKSGFEHLYDRPQYLKSF